MYTYRISVKSNFADIKWDLLTGEAPDLRGLYPRDQGAHASRR